MDMRAKRKADTVVVVGAGLSGIATALGAAMNGLDVVVLESADMIGGAAAFSGGQVWVGDNHVARREGLSDSAELAEQYVRHIGHAHPEYLDEAAMKRWLAVSPVAIRHWEDVGAIRWAVIPGLADYHNEAPGAQPAGRYLTNERIDGSILGEWRAKLRISPYFPVGTTYAEMFEKGRRLTQVDDEEASGESASVQGFGMPENRDNAARPAAAAGTDPLTFGPGVVGSFLAKALQYPNIRFLLEHPVTELLRDAQGQVTGVRAQSPAGPVVFEGTVVLATSTYDWDAELVQELVGLGPDDFGSVAPRSVKGDGIRLVRAIGGAVVQLPATCIPMLPGWKTTTGVGYAYGPDYAMPHAIIVDKTGRRYCDDSYWVDIVARTMNPQDMHLPFYMVFDEQHHQKYGLGATPPGGAYPDGMVESAPTLEALGARLGIDGAQLARTAARFSEHALQGTDPDFGRGTVDYVRRFAGDPQHQPNPVLGPINIAPFFGFRLRFVGTGIGSSGIHIDADGHVLDTAGQAIPGLYAVGSCAAYTTTGVGYNSGFALGRGITLAYQVSQELAGLPVLP
jgi:3-oxosteroid 1-dehydrogenase